MNEEIFTVVREAVAATKHSAAGVRHLSIRPGTVASVATDGVIAIVKMDDAELLTEAGDDTLEEGGIPAQIVYPTGLIPGDRVAVATVPGGGTFIFGRRAGDYEPWTYVGDVDPDGNEVGPPFGTGWTNRTGIGAPGTDTHAGVSFRRLGRTVELRGRADRTSGTGTTIFTLPNWYRPQNRVAVPCVVGEGGVNVIGFVTIAPTGLVTFGTLGTPETSVFLDGVMFTIDSGEDEEVVA